MVLLLALVAVALAVGVFRYREWRARSNIVRQVLDLPSDRPLLTRRAVAVLGLDNLSGDPDAGWLGTAIAEMLRTELAASETLRLVSGDDSARMEVELRLGAAAGGPASVGGSDGGAPRLSRETLERIHRASGTDYVVAGSYTVVGESPNRRIRLDLQLRDAIQGETVAPVAETGTENELFDLVARVGERLRERLGAEVPETGTGAVRRAAVPATPEAARLYAEGLERMRSFEPAAARDLFARAAEIEPSHPLIHSGLALAWSSLGYEGRAREEAQRALELAEGLPAEERLAIEARYREAVRDWDRAVETWRSLWALHPDNAEYGHRLAAAQTQAGRPRDALTTVAALRSLPAPTGEDPRIDLAEATAAASLADPERQRQAAARAAAKGEEQGSRLLVAEARLAECSALLQLSRPQEARRACEASREIYAASGDRAGQATAMFSTASILYDQGDLSAARKLFEQSLDTYREMGNSGAVARVLNNLAVVVANQGELDPARRMYQEGLDLFRQIGSQDGEATALVNLAPLLVRLGELSQAAQSLEQALAIRRQMRDRRGEAGVLDQLGVVLRRQGHLAEGRQRHREALQTGRELGLRRSEVLSLDHLAETALEEGDLEGARQRFEQSLALCREIGYRSPEGSALYGIAEVRFEQGDLDTARQRHREALSLREELGERGSAAESRSALARVLIESGELAEAESLARAAVEAFSTQGSIDRRDRALIVLSRVLRKQGRIEEAGEALRRAREHSAASEDEPLRLALTVEGARLEALDGDAERALATLASAIESAREAGFFTLQLEARLARLEIEAGRGESHETSLDAELLAADARARDYERVARAAERLAAGAPLPTSRTPAS